MSREEGFDASDASSVEARERKARQTDRELDRALEAVLSDPAGRKVVWWIVTDLAGWFEPAFTGNSATFYNEGRRHVGTRIVERIIHSGGRRFGDLITEMTERDK